MKIVKLNAYYFKYNADKCYKFMHKYKRENILRLKYF